MKALLLRALGIALMLTALAVGLSHAPDRSVETLVARWAPPPSDFVEVKGQLVHLRDEGPRDDPLPLVLLHGTSSSLHTWEGWVAALKTQHRVLTLDLPGFGLTGPWTGAYAGRPYNAAEDARFVLDVLDARGLQRVALGGNSLGGEVAWRVAAATPARVDRLLLVDASGLGVDTQAVPLAWQVARLPLFGRIGEWLLPRALVAQGVAAAYAHPERIREATVDRYFELTLREGNRHAFVERARAWDARERPAQALSLALPTLVLWGGQDRFIPPSKAREFAQRLPASRVVVFDDLGHVPQEEDPLRTVQPVKAFLEGG